ncbi:MAG: hypothetical protein RLZZ324_92 [Candidatus Parcubacteria bacterium]|jgi:hypothetical protein
MERTKDLYLRFAKCQSAFRKARRLDPRIRPFFVESFGLPKSYKTTFNNGVEHFLKREEWLIFAPPEGPEMVPVPYGRTPLFNFETFWYSMRNMYMLHESLFEAILLERAIFDHVTWLEYWTRKGKISKHERKIGEDYALQPLLRDKFDLHLCFVADPAVALAREVSSTISKREGETMNTGTLETLLDIHQTVYDRFKGANDPKMRWIDTTTMPINEVVLLGLEYICEAFEARVKTLK